MLNMDVAVRDINPEIWKEVKAQARLEGITIGKWLERAIVHFGSEQKVRERAPEIVPCHYCGRTISKKGKGSNKLLIHHDKPNNFTASVAVPTCPPCHRKRHQQLGWGVPWPKKKIVHV
jgi:hypothetical protein